GRCDRGLRDVFEAEWGGPPASPGRTGGPPHWRRQRGWRALLHRQGRLRQLPHGAGTRRRARARPFPRRPPPHGGADRAGVARSRRHAGGSGWTRRTWGTRRAIVSRGHRASARRTYAPRHREERERIRSATAVGRWRAAPVIEGPGRGDRSRKIADAEGRG